MHFVTPVPVSSAIMKRDLLLKRFEFARCREGKVRRLSTDFGSAGVNIRVLARDWAPVVSRWCGVVMLGGFPTRLDPNGLFVV